MRILEWIDQDRFDSESLADAATLAALLEDGHRILRVLPTNSGGDPTEATLPSSRSLRRFEWAGASRWRERGEVARLCDRFEESTVDVVWLRGRGVWSPGRRAASMLSTGCWIELGSLQEATATRSLRGGDDLVLSVPVPSFSTSLPAEIRRRVAHVEPPTGSAPERGGRTPLSVPPPLQPPMPITASTNTDGPFPMVVLSGGRSASDRGRDRCLAAIAAIARKNPGAFEVFLEDPIVEVPGVRKLLATSGLQPVVTAIPSIRRCRGMLAQPAILVVPTPVGRLEPAVLEAVSRGARVVATADPAQRDWLGDRQRGVVVPPRASAGRWESALVEAMASPPQPAPPMIERWLDPALRIEAVRSVLRRFEGPIRVGFRRSGREAAGSH